MKKTYRLRFAAFLLALLLCISLGATSALAAGVPAGQSPSPEEKAVADIKAEVVALVNAEREKAGVAALSVLDTLAVPADTRAQEASQTFKHTRPDGTRCFTVFADYSLRYRAAGENLAYGYNTSTEAMTAWMNSPAHKANILDPDFKYVGIGYYINTSGVIYLSQLFYTPLAS